MARRLTTEQFIEKAKISHNGTKYDYSKSVYVKNTVPVCIICIKCGFEFYQTPASHLLGYGCKKCSSKARFMSKDEFIKKANAIHGIGSYCYCNSVIKGTKEKTEILCNDCNEHFWQDVGNHIAGSGCPVCANKSRSRIRRDTKDDFIRKANDLHGIDVYDYSQSIYVNSRTPLEIRCVKHNSFFSQKPNNHLMGQGCRDCGYERNGDNHRKTLDEFIDHARSIHGDKFDYSNVEYKSAHVPVLIICDNGHENYQTPANHLHGAECRACKYAEREGGFTFENAENDPEKYKQPCLFYRVKITNKNNGNVFEKVGITTRTIKERFHNDNKRGFHVDIITTHEGTLLECMDLESLILSELKDSGMLYKIHDLKEYSHNGSGWSECYYPKSWYN